MPNLDLIQSAMRHLPNTLTCLNLFCGSVAALFVIQGKVAEAAILLALCLLFDLLDGMVARMLGVASPIGKELDSLADMVSFGVVPGLMMASMIQHVQQLNFPASQLLEGNGLWLTGIVVIVFSGLRLAKFNVDTRQSDQFIGMPTPANTLLIFSYWYICFESPDHFLFPVLQNPYVLVGLAILSSGLLVAELPLIALKFKVWSFAANRNRYILIASALLLFVFLGVGAIPFIILLYICLSIFQNRSSSQQGHS